MAVPSLFHSQPLDKRLEAPVCSPAPFFLSALSSVSARSSRRARRDQCQIIGQFLQSQITMSCEFQDLYYIKLKDTVAISAVMPRLPRPFIFLDPAPCLVYLGGKMKKALILVALIALAGCHKQVVRFDQYSVAMNLAVEADSSIYLGDGDKFNGVLFINQILAAEMQPVKAVKLIQNYGRYYLCAEDFKNLWQIEPKADGVSAKYKAIDVTPEDKTDLLKNVNLSRYGTDEKACVRFRFNGKEIFINQKGGLNEECK
jgi:hypothetical protein